MAFENLVGLFVIDDIGYQNYRKAMMPILHQYGGRFGYDLKIAEVLKSEVDNHINRVFTIRFPDKATMKAFFKDEAYLSVRKQYFEPAVTDVTIMAAYHI
ncbi:DUF1330 domain-containing protein [Aliikangiella maris]|uniref:DUF1330 domain-containing protein n=2 Tax=Aliikangiella maris TaxID=3162458 RepID=A0ABV3MSM8_9GAMM